MSLGSSLGAIRPAGEHVISPSDRQERVAHVVIGETVGHGAKAISLAPEDLGS